LAAVFRAASCDQPREPFAKVWNGILAPGSGKGLAFEGVGAAAAERLKIVCLQIRAYPHQPVLCVDEKAAPIAAFPCADKATAVCSGAGDEVIDRLWFVQPCGGLGGEGVPVLTDL